jgi:hypothetical protein
MQYPSTATPMPRKSLSPTSAPSTATPQEWPTESSSTKCPSLVLEAGFAHSLATSLYMGNVMWNTQTTPSNLSPFTIFELDPLSSTQMAHCFHLHLLSKNMEGKSLDEI